MNTVSNIRSFEDLECWKQAAGIRRKISLMVRSFPSEEKFRLSDQMIRASRSVTNNIAEGYGRYHFLENAKFCRNSRGSLTELQDHLLVALDEKYITTEIYNELKNDILNCQKVLNGYVKYLLKAKLEDAQ